MPNTSISSKKYRIRTESRALLLVAMPYIMLQAGMMNLGILDIQAAGGFGIHGIAVIGLVISWRVIALLVAQGAAAGLVTMFTYSWMRRELTELGGTFKHGACVLAALSIPIGVWYYFAEGGLRLLGQPADLAHEAGILSRISMLSLPGFIGFSLIQNFLQGIEKIKYVIGVVISANILKAVLNPILTAHFGIVGIIWASVAVSVIMCFAVFVLAYPTLKIIPFTIRLNELGLRYIVGFTLPIGLAWALETAMINTVTILAGKLGVVALAAHVIASNLYGPIYTFPICWSVAAAIRTAQRYALHEEWRLTATVSLILSCLVMLIPSLAFIFMPVQIGQHYTQYSTTLSLLKTILPILGIFEIFDSIQITALGILRGIGDVAFPSMMYSGGIWLISLPLAALFAFYLLPGGLIGLWIGLLLGVIIIMSALLWRLHFQCRTRPSLKTSTDGRVPHVRGA